MSKPRAANIMQPSAAYSLLRQLDSELWLADRLKSHGVDVFDGDTMPDVRAQRTREAILAHGLAAVVLGKRHGVLETYASAYERIFNQPLVVAAPRPKHRRST